MNTEKVVHSFRLQWTAEKKKNNRKFEKKSKTRKQGRKSFLEKVEIWRMEKVKATEKRTTLTDKLVRIWLGLAKTWLILAQSTNALSLVRSPDGPTVHPTRYSSAEPSDHAPVVEQRREESGAEQPEQVGVALAHRARRRIERREQVRIARVVEVRTKQQRQ